MMQIYANLAQNRAMTLEEILYREIQEYKESPERRWMLTGDRYYRVDNDVNRRRMMRQTEQGPQDDPTKTNNKLAHGSAKNLVDEKVGYVMAKEHSLTCEDRAALEKVKAVLGKHFQYTLATLGYESSNKGIGWLYPYIDSKGAFKLYVVPSEQCLPLWADDAHTELQGMLRFYLQTEYVGRERKVVTKVEYYTEDAVSYYTMTEDALVPNEDGQDTGHYTRGGAPASWGRVPFVPFKNNRIEYPDLRFIKSLVDNYDYSRSDVANFIEEVKNLIYILKGYGGEGLSEFLHDLNYYRAIKIDDTEGAGVDTLNPTIDINAAKEHFEQLKRDINEFGQGVSKDLDKFGSAPSGVALKFLYSGLDIKCNHMEIEFKLGFEQLLYFVGQYLEATGQGALGDSDVKIIFNRDVAINEEAAIQGCVDSKEIISDETIVANHPWVTDVEKELAAVKKEKAEKLKQQQAAFGVPGADTEDVTDDEDE